MGIQTNLPEASGSLEAGIRLYGNADSSIEISHADRYFWDGEKETPSDFVVRMASNALLECDPKVETIDMAVNIYPVVIPEGKVNEEGDHLPAFTYAKTSGRRLAVKEGAGGYQDIQVAVHADFYAETEILMDAITKFLSLASPTKRLLTYGPVVDFYEHEIQRATGADFHAFRDMRILL